MSTELTGAPAPLDLSSMTREEWLAARVCGASDTPTICGLNTFRTVYDLWAEKIGIKPAFEGNELTAFGLKLEPFIAAEFGERSGLVVQKCETMFTHPKHHYMTCTPDYHVFRGSDKGLSQIKNTSAWMAKHWEGGIPDAVHVQCLTEIEITGAPFNYAVGLIGGNRIEYREVLPDAAVQARICERVAWFWDLVVTRTPPPMVAEDAETIKKIFPTSEAGLEIALPGEAEEWLELRAKAAEALKSATAQKDLAEANLKRLMGNAERGRIGKKIVSWKSGTRAGYTVEPTVTRTFSVKEEK